MLYKELSVELSHKPINNTDLCYVKGKGDRKREQLFKILLPIMHQDMTGNVQFIQVSVSAVHLSCKISKDLMRTLKSFCLLLFYVSY